MPGLFAVDVDDIRLTTHFLNDIGMDSLDMIELVMALECVFGQTIADDDAVNLLTVGDVCAYLEKHKIPETALDKVALDVAQVGAQPGERPDYDEDLVLTRYVWCNSGHLMSDFERQVANEMYQREKAQAYAYAGRSEAVRAPILSQLSQDPQVHEALKQGHRAFRDGVRDRLLREEAETVVVDRCPRCERIVRTPQARQCLWCGFDWHDPARTPGGEVRQE